MTPSSPNPALSQTDRRWQGVCRGKGVRGSPAPRPGNPSLQVLSPSPDRGGGGWRGGGGEVEGRERGCQDLGVGGNRGFGWTALNDSLPGGAGVTCAVYCSLFEMFYVIYLP